MPEKFDSENLDDIPETEIAGGPAIKPKPKNGSTNIIDVAKNKVTDEALDFATGGAWEAAKRIPIIGKYLDELKNKAVKLASKQFWKALLAANWPTFTTIAVIIVLLLGILVPAFSGISRSRKCWFGKCLNSPASAYSSDDVNGIKGILGAGYSLKGDPKDWYFNQNDKTLGWADYIPAGNRRPLGETGCVITSFAMMAKYYGIQTNPKQLIVDSGAKGQDWPAMQKWIVDQINQSGKSFKWSEISSSDTNSIKSHLDSGNPVFIYALHLNGSSTKHAGVIVGFDQATSRMVVNDPIFGPEKVSSFPPKNGSVEYLWAIDEQ